MTKNIKALLTCALIVTAIADTHAQGQSYEEFRASIMADFNSFKSRILDHYSDFLDGVWHEYEPLEMKERYTAPKPETIPDARVMRPIDNASFDMESRTVETVRHSTHAVAEADTTGVTVPYIAESVKPVREMTLPPAFPLQKSDEDRVGRESVVYHGMEFLIPAHDYKVMADVPDPAKVSWQWRQLKKQGVADVVVPALRETADSIGLSDYLVYDFVKEYVNGKFADASEVSRMSVIHYILANMGYDARFGFSQTDAPVIMLRSDQPLYQVPRIDLDGGIYYMFTSSPSPILAVRTCYIPACPDMGDKFDFRIKDGLRLPMREGDYDIAFGKIHIKGKLNRNIFPVVYRYPQLACEAYAQSSLLPEVKADVVRQVREQLAGMEVTEAVEELLAFCQLGFQYSTDPTYHGFEKPYFFEENLYFPVNDCEDRSIFYTYLLWNALGLETHLLEYPEHESAAVALPYGIKGTGYRLDGKKYYISDPTYLHARTGQCMPPFARTVPTINYRYQ